MVYIYIVKTARRQQFCDLGIDTIMQGINGIEKKIGGYKLVAKTSEPEIEQKYL